MAIEVFNRYEKKYLLNTFTYLKLQDALAAYMELDSHNLGGKFYTISSLYYDTEDNAFIRTSLSKPRYKEKLRLRAYGVPSAEDAVFVELKKKYNGKVNKRRTTLPLQEAYQFLREGRLPDPVNCSNLQVAREVAYLYQRAHLIPKLYLAYNRRAFFGRGQADLRVSFDTNLRTRRTDLALEAGDYGEPLLPNDVWLMEVKTEKSIPLWLSELLSRHQLYSTSFSKYGTEYQNFVASTIRKERIPCWTFCSQPESRQHSRLAVPF